MSQATKNEGYDEFIEAIEDGEGYYLECPNGHASVPPQRVCPTCSSTELTQTEMPDTGTIESYTTTNVAAPDFKDDAPYHVAIASFGNARITGQVREIDQENLDIGNKVTIDIESTETKDQPLIVFKPK